MSNFFYGVIEGFYGRQWSWQTRTDYASFLANYGFDCYIYAPKGDSFLRADWQQPFPASRHLELSDLARTYQNAGLRFGVGISPQGLFQSYTSQERHALQEKIEAINAIGADIICVLFDDMPGNFPGLASRQLEIIDDVLAISRASYHVVCPSYYSFDPVLEDVFGPMPTDYLVDLGHDLPRQVDLFWTGNKVISSEYTKQDIERISALFGRAPLLWDNYPVNDGRLTSAHLHLRPYQGRPRELSEWVKGHCVNPMNQPQLSKYVLASLADIYQNQGSALRESALEKMAPQELRELLAGDIVNFQDRGRLSLSPEKLQTKIAQYQRFDCGIAQEIVDWLQGGYSFDPACLTD